MSESRELSETREALKGAEFYLRVDLEAIRRERYVIERPEDRRDPSGECEEICGEVLGKVREALADQLDARAKHVGERVQRIVNNYDALDYRRKRAVNVIGIIDQLREALEKDR